MPKMNTCLGYARVVEGEKELRRALTMLRRTAVNKDVTVSDMLDILEKEAEYARDSVTSWARAMAEEALEEARRKED